MIVVATLLLGGCEQLVGSEDDSDTDESVGEVEVLHWWTSGGESAAVDVLKTRLQEQGVTWQESTIGDGSASTIEELQSRVESGNPPTAVQMLGFDIQYWAQADALANLSNVAQDEDWGDVVPSAVQEFSIHNGDWVAVPVNLHSTNWIWANAPIMNQLNIDQPTNWSDFTAALQSAQDDGKTALAHCNQQWQTSTIFEAVVLQTGGPQFYADALNEPIEANTLDSSTMEDVFTKMAELRSYADIDTTDCNWPNATAMVADGSALFQMMGDWAKGEFFNADLAVDEDFTGFRTPGTSNSVLFNSDQFAMFKVPEDEQAAQEVLARETLSPEFQIAFNTVKGSIPARTDLSMDEFTPIGQAAMQQLKSAESTGTLLGSFTHDHGAPSKIVNAMAAVVQSHFNGEYSSAAEAADELKTAYTNATN
jgi:glucose/mannose transport system substrate-binding protein